MVFLPDANGLAYGTTRFVETAFSGEGARRYIVIGDAEQIITDGRLFRSSASSENTK